MKHITVRMNEANVSNVPVYISLPPVCSKIDCFKTESFHEETMLDFVKTKLQDGGNEEYAVGIPMTQGKYGAFYTTGAGMPLKIINSLLEETTSANLDLVSIEPDILAAIRFIWQYDKRFIILDVGENTAYLTGYDYSKGLFTTPYGTLGADSLLSNGLDGLKKELRLFGMVAQETLGGESFENSPLYILTDCPRENAQKMITTIKADSDIGPRVCAMGSTAITRISLARNLKPDSHDIKDCLNLALGLAFKSLFEGRNTLAESANDEFIAGDIPAGAQMPEKEKPNKTWFSGFDRFIKRNNAR